METETPENVPSSPESLPPESTPPQKHKVSNTDIIKFVGLLVFIALLVVIGLALLPYFNYLTSVDGRIQLKEIIQSGGIIGVGICLGLQFVQIVVAFIPGEVIQVVIGGIYGPLFGTIIIVVGALIASSFIFFVVRKLGTPFVQGMIGTKHNKVLDFLRGGKQLNALVFVLFLIPGLPKDIFTYLFPLTTIRPVNFLLLSNLARIPSVIASAYIGSAALQGDYVQAIIVGVIAGGLGLAGIIFNKRIIAQIDRIEKRVRRK